MSSRKAKKLVRNYIKWWTNWLGLRYQIVKLCFMEFIKDTDGPDTVAVCHTDWRYQVTTIDFDLHKLRDLNKEVIERVVVHELMHIFLNEMREEGIDHEERVATQLQKAFMWVRDGAKK